MCFSASASFIASAVLGSAGLFILRTFCSKKNRRIWPFALIPCIFSVQQFMEGISWITHNRGDLVFLQPITGYGFLIIAAAFWPLWIPLSMYLLEKEEARKKGIFAIGILGCAVSFGGIYYLAQIGAGMNFNCHHISYVLFSECGNDPFWGVPLKLPVSFVYMISVVAPFFISSVRGMKLCGLLVLVGWIVAWIAYTEAFGSVWCFFAAVISFLIYFVMRQFKSK